MNDSKLVDYLLLGTLALIWSTSFLLIKIAIETIGPFSLTAARLILAAIFLVIILALKGERLPIHTNAIKLYLVVGIFGNSVPFAMISLGEVYIDSSLAAILMGIMPISTFVLAHFFIPSEPMTPRKVFGVFLGFTGLITLVGLAALKSLGGQLFGQLVVLFGALCYSFTAIYVRRQPTFNGFHMATGAVVVAAISSVPAALLLEHPFDMTPDSTALASTVALGFFHTGIAALIYFRTIRNLGAVIFAQINYLVPVLGSLWGVLILGEFIGWRIVAALSLVLIGIYFIQPKRQAKQ